MVNAVDQKLAAAHHLRQIEALIRLERISEQVDGVLDAAYVAAFTKRARVVATGIPDSSPTFRPAVKALIGVVRGGYVDFADWSFNTAVASIASAVPRRYFRGLSPRLAMFEADQNVFSFLFDDDEGGDEDDPLTFLRQLIGELQVDNFTEPIAASKVKKLNDEQWQGVLQTLIFPSPSPERSRELIEAKDENGFGFEERLELLTKKADDADRVADEIITGFSEGENLAELRRRVQPLVGGIKSSAKRVVRTEGLRIAERMQRETWAPLGDSLLAVQILAVLDENTRSHHAVRNGRLHYREPVGNQLGFDTLPMLPDEPNCRCWSTPVLRPPPGLENNPALQAAFANVGGEGIPDPTTYDQWFNAVGEGRRKLAVGSRRYDAVKALLNGQREPEWTDFIDAETGKILSVDTLRNESPIDRILRKQGVNSLIAARRDAIAEIARTGFLVN